MLSNAAYRACAKMEYPEGKHTIQVLDDSTDATSELVQQIAERT